MGERRAFAPAVLAIPDSARKANFVDPEQLGPGVRLRRPRGRARGRQALSRVLPETAQLPELLRRGRLRGGGRGRPLGHRKGRRLGRDGRDPGRDGLRRRALWLEGRGAREGRSLGGGRHHPPRARLHLRAAIALGPPTRLWRPSLKGGSRRGGRSPLGVSAPGAPRCHLVRELVPALHKASLAVAVERCHLRRRSRTLGHGLSAHRERTPRRDAVWRARLRAGSSSAEHLAHEPCPGSSFGTAHLGALRADGCHSTSDMAGPASGFPTPRIPPYLNQRSAIRQGARGRTADRAALSSGSSPVGWGAPEGRDRRSHR